MADIAAADVTYTLSQQRRSSDAYVNNKVKLQFGNGALTVGSGGIPLTPAKMGCPTTVGSIVVVDQGTSGYKFQYDSSTGKLVVLFCDYDAVADGPMTAYTGAIAAQTIYVTISGY